MNPKHRSLVCGACIAVIVLAGVWMPVHAQGSGQDKAMQIFDLARQVYYENVKLESFTSWVNGNIGADKAGVPTRLRTGQIMPDFKFKVFNKDAQLSRADLKGPYLLNFWASWCPPCRDEFPLLADSIDSGKLSMPVVFVDVFDKNTDAQRFLWSLSSHVTIALDSTRTPFARKYGLNAIPQTVLVDAEGKIQAIHSGGMTDLTVEFFSLIAKNPGIGGFDASNPDEPPANMATTASR